MRSERIKLLGSSSYGRVVDRGLAQGPTGAPYEAVKVRWDDGSLGWAACHAVVSVSDVVGDYVELPFGDRLAKLEVV